MYQRVILVPRPDYASRVILWRHLLIRNAGRITDTFDLSSLSKVTDGFTAGHINAAITTVLNERRIQQVYIRYVPAGGYFKPLCYNYNTVPVVIYAHFFPECLVTALPSNYIIASIY